MRELPPWDNYQPDLNELCSHTQASDFLDVNRGGELMNKAYRFAAALAALSTSTTAIASPNWEIQPIQKGSATERFLRGVPTVDLELNDGVVEITPLPLDHGSLAFSIAVYNDSRRPSNMGIEQIHVTFNGQPVAVFTEQALVKKAKNRAMWSQIGLALLGGVAAGAAASQRIHYRSTFITPRGTYRSWFSAPSVAGQFHAAAITASTGYGIAAVQGQLDRTIGVLGDQVIQLTTVDPGESYAGEFVIDKIRPKSLPAIVDVTIDWNGESYPFEFQLAKSGTPAPVFTQIAARSDLIDFRQSAEAATRPDENASSRQPSPAVEVQASVETAQSLSAAHGLNSNAQVHCDTCR
jgi:hypothetical protein